MSKICFARLSLNTAGLRNSLKGTLNRHTNHLSDRNYTIRVAARCEAVTSIEAGTHLIAILQQLSKHEFNIKTLAFTFVSERELCNRYHAIELSDSC
jgi:hypothetical protein